MGLGFIGLEAVGSSLNWGSLQDSLEKGAVPFR